MKKRFLTAAVLFICSMVNCFGAGWLKGPDRDWFVRLEPALQKARAENKKVYVLQTGSDWCGWCVRLYKDVLSSSEFKRFAKNNLVLLYLDFPRRKKMPQDQKAYNRQTVRKLRFGGGYPAAVVLDAQGNVIAKKSGYAKRQAYMQFLKSAVQKTAAGSSGSSVNNTYGNLPVRYNPQNNAYGGGAVPQGASAQQLAAQYQLPPAPQQAQQLAAQYQLPPAPQQAQQLAAQYQLPPAPKSAWLPGPGPQWHIKLETAVEEARRTNKKIYALKTGSDWCTWCSRLYTDVLSQNAFLTFANQNLVLLYLDFPSQKSMPQEQSSYNNKTAAAIGASGGYPTAVILDSNGRFLKKISGFASADSYLEQVRSAGKK